MIFDEPEPWSKAKICPFALEQSSNVHERRKAYEAKFGLGSWNAAIAEGGPSRKRMAEFDALPPEWRAYCHEHGLPKTKVAIKAFGLRSAKRASVIAAINLDALDL